MDKNGRFIILEANVQDHPFLFVNLYAPNKINEQSTLFDEVSEELDNFCLAEDCNIIMGGDFNVIFDIDLDGNGGNPKRKEALKCIDNICLANDLVNIWRIRNPNVKRFTWRQKTMIQRRLDLWLVSNAMQEGVIRYVNLLTSSCLRKRTTKQMSAPAMPRICPNKTARRVRHRPDNVPIVNPTIEPEREDPCQAPEPLDSVSGCWCNYSNYLIRFEPSH